MTEAASKFWTGLTLVPAGWRLLNQKKSLWAFVLIPWLIDVAVLIVGWVYGLGGVQTLTLWAIGKLSVSGWVFDFLYYPLVVILGFMFLILWLFAVLAVATVIAAPFNGLLAERGLKAQGVKTVSIDGIFAWAKLSLRMLWTSVLKGLVFATAGLALFILSFFPGINLVAAYASMCIFAADVFDYSFEARGYSLRERFKNFRILSKEISGLGGSLLVTSLIPGLTVLLLPVAVLGATTVLAQRWKENS